MPPTLAPDGYNRGFVIGGRQGEAGWSGEFEMQTTLLSSLTTHHSKEGYDP